MGDRGLFRRSLDEAVHRITAGTNNASGKALPGRAATLAILFVALEIDAISSG